MGIERPTGTNENIQTFGNGTRDYTDLAVWEAATDNDLVTAAQSEVLECYADLSVFNSRIGAFGAITSSLYPRIVRPAPGQKHDGTENTGVILNNTNSTVDAYNLVEDNFSFQDLVIRSTVNTTINRIVHRIENYVNNSSVGIIIGSSVNTGTGIINGIVVRAGPGSGQFTNIIDCSVAKMESAPFYAQATTGTVIFSNCTAVDTSGNGFTRSTGTAIAKNCLATGSSLSDFLGTFDAASTNNASGDASAPILNGRINQTFIFQNAAGNDYHLDPTDAGARGFGVNLSADVNFPITADIDNQLIVTWSIGADAEAGAGFLAATYGDVPLGVSEASAVIPSYTQSEIFQVGVLESQESRIHVQEVVTYTIGLSPVLALRVDVPQAETIQIQIPPEVANLLAQVQQTEMITLQVTPEVTALLAQLQREDDIRLVLNPLGRATVIYLSSDTWSIALTEDDVTVLVVAGHVLVEMSEIFAMHVGETGEQVHIGPLGSLSGIPVEWTAHVRPDTYRITRIDGFSSDDRMM